MAAESMEFEEVALSTPEDKPPDIESQEVPTGVAQSRRSKKRRIVIALSVAIVLATMILAIGLSVGLTQRPNKDTTESASSHSFLSTDLPRPVIIDTDYGKSIYSKCITFQ